VINLDEVTIKLASTSAIQGLQ